MAAHHDSREALAFFAREIPHSAMSMAQSIIGGGGGLPRPMPLIRVHSMLVPREFVTVRVNDESVNDEPFVAVEQEWATPNGSMQADDGRECVTDYDGETVGIPILKIAYGRSGDKGNISNIGIVARRPEFVPILRRELTAEKVRVYLAHLVESEVERFELPGLDAFNFVLHEALGGGGTASLRFDPLGKGMAQILLECEFRVPVELL